MRPYVEVTFCWDEYQAPIRMSLPIDVSFEDFDPIDWKIDRDSTGLELFRSPLTSEQKVRRLLENREFVARKLADAVIRALGRRDTDSGYPLNPPNP